MTTASEDKFPWRQLGVLAICRLAEPVAFVSITAYAFVMVQEINGDKDASFYAGLLVSAFALAEACTAWLWGDLSDRFGRKPIILVALAGTALSSLIFGFSKSYWLALVARVIGGALNGNVAVMQTMVAEIATKPEWEPKAYALQPFMWSVGSIAGSALGGFAAQPAKFHPGWFAQDGIFAEYPYLLPNLIAVAVIVVAFILGFFFLEETNPNFRVEEEESPKPAETSTVDERTPLHPRARRDSVMSRATEYSTAAPYVSVSVPTLTDPSIDLRRASIASLRSSILFRSSIQDLKAAATFEDDSSDSESEDSASMRPKIFNRAVVVWTIALWILCYHTMAFSSLLPIYLLDDPRTNPGQLDLLGGLGETLPEVGTILAINSVASLGIQGFFFPWYVERFGVWISVVSALVMAPFVYIVVPFSTLLPIPDVGIYATLFLQSLFANLAYPTLLILIKNSCSSSKVLGRVNGIAMSGCSGARTLAPPLAGIFYSSFGSAAAWWITAVTAALGLVEIYFAPRSNESKRSADQEARDILND